MPESVVMTLPRDARFVPVARLVVGGLAARLDMPLDAMDDLQLAVEAVLAHDCVDGPGELEIAIDVEDGRMVARIGPIGTDDARAALEGAGDGLGLGRLLPSLVDGLSLEDRDGAAWLALVKRTPDEQCRSR